MTITNGTKKVTINIKPKTIYLLNPDFTYKKSEDFSGIQFALKTGEDHETRHKVTFYELELPNKLCARFEIQKR